VTHHGPSGDFEDVTLEPRPVQDPFDVWLGGLVPAALRRCGRLADGWLPSLCTPEEAAAGKEVVDRSAAEAGRTISEEHFGVSVLYAEGDGPGDALARLAGRRGAQGGRLRGHSLEELVPHGLVKLRARLEQFLEVGFSKFVVRSLSPDSDARAQRERLAAAVGDLQT
jgi:alkanesulfonate monooxygenase SsuD/methylene tetrahydromethanopterin reductase-like flavin-dependent oxidoreductase (luciferase family)